MGKRKYLMMAALLISLGTTKVGVMQGEVEKPITAPQALAGTALVNQEPLASSQLAKRTVTGYSSDPSQTDNTPFITASGETVHQGIIAANWLPFGTKVRFPELFGDQIFIVEDRMNEVNRSKVDVWFPSKGAALQFGVHRTTVEIL
ncbi:MAG TPA: hypothetical protein VMU70_02155 [Candidatus Tyrphobacter sp.]|nr:hypothetical protein [Candidatus Tyrphobacter sp.]